MTYTTKELLAQQSEEEWRRRNRVRREPKPWVPPDWAPRDAGDVLLRDGDWVTVKDYELASQRPTSVVVHMCDGGPWVKVSNPPQLASDGCCDHCQAKAPDTVRGFNAMMKWNR